jgi:hypothetical protein
VIKLKVVIQAPPSGVAFALQKGKGGQGMSDVATVSDGGDVLLGAELDVRDGKLAGPFVQKDAEGAFVYVRIGQSAGQTDTEWNRRAKLYLHDVRPDWETAEIRYAGTFPDGSPTCAKVKESVTSGS